MSGLSDIFPGLFNELSKILEQIGIDAHTLVFLKSGFSTKVFDTGHGQVLKIRDNDITAQEWPGAFLPQSPYVLQPVCSYENFAGQYEIALFPKIYTDKVMDIHSNALKYLLNADGLDFFDCKKENIGLAGNIPYVIDSDAIKPLDIGVFIQKPHLLHVLKWPESQWELFPCMVLGTQHPMIPKEGWIFSGEYGYVPKEERKVTLFGNASL